MARPAALPLVTRFPALASVPRVALGAFPTPVQSLERLAPHLWIKRDDLCADPLGGNKVRALEFLLGPVKKDDTVATVGSEGSTHALALATYGKKIGARVVVGRWTQEMNDSAKAISARTALLAAQAPVFSNPVFAYAWAARERLRGAHWIAAGGSTPLGILGHVNAGFELIDQVDAGVMAMPKYIVAPLGTGGTLAGLTLAFAIAERSTTFVGARVVPRIVAREGRVRQLANSTARFIEKCGNTRVPRVKRGCITLAHETFGGAYGRATNAGRAAADGLHAAAGIDLDSTYSAKAFAKALELGATAPTLFWLTFDVRGMRPSRVYK